MIRALASQGGVIHIAFHDGFLSQEYANASRAHISEIETRENAINEKFGKNEAQKFAEWQHLNDDLIRAGKLPPVGWQKIVEHVDHAVQLVGPDHVGLGSDFDGAFMPSGLEDASKFPRITEDLLRRGYSEADIRKILGENTLRILADVA
jgi:membrane dipeptidase